MPRYNLFKSAHFSCQEALLRGAGQLADSDTAAQAPALADVIKLGIRLVQAENTAILPAVDAYEPAVVDAVKQAHRAAVTEAAGLLRLLEMKETPVLSLRYNRYMITQLSCMAKAEELINPVLWYYYSDAELQVLEVPLQALAGQKIGPRQEAVKMV